VTSKGDKEETRRRGGGAARKGTRKDIPRPRTSTSRRPGIVFLALALGILMLYHIY